jgi:hypothetical protein
MMMDAGCGLIWQSSLEAAFHIFSGCLRFLVRRPSQFYLEPPLFGVLPWMLSFVWNTGNVNHMNLSNFDMIFNNLS